jgi:hypothetical protein
MPLVYKKKIELVFDLLVVESPNKNNFKETYIQFVVKRLTVATLMCHGDQLSPGSCPESDVSS